MKEYNKVCAVCGKDFIAHSHTSKICSDACRRVRAKECRLAHEEKCAKEAEKARMKKKKKGKPLVDMAVEARKRGMTYGQYVAYLECEKQKQERKKCCHS